MDRSTRGGLGRRLHANVAELNAWRARTWTRTLDWLKEKLRNGCSIDLFLSYFYPTQIEPTAIREIQRMGVPCVNFFADNVREFTKVPEEYHCFDLQWVPEFEALPMYREAGLKVVHAPMPVWVDPKHRTIASRETQDVAFIGSADFLRRELLRDAISAGAPLRIRGPGWIKEDDTAVPQNSHRPFVRLVKNQTRFVRERGVAEWLRKISQTMQGERAATIAQQYISPPVFGDDYVRVTKQSQVVIGINRVPTFHRSLRHPLKYSRLRDIEAPMMGACYLTEWTEGLDQLYQVGTEVESYRTAEEMVAKIDWLKRDQAKRQNLRQLGQRRALTDLTIAKSLKKICLALNLGA